MADVSLTLLMLKTRQIERLRLFYQTLGITLAQEQHGRGLVHFAGLAGDVVIEIYPAPEDGSPVESSTRLGFALRGVAEVVRALQAIGTKIITPPRETAWGYQAVVHDPDGRPVELTQRP